MTRIFGRDLFADPAQVPGYLELLGIDAHKPFECVGEVEESLVALSMLNDDAPVLVRAARGRAAGGVGGGVPRGGAHPERADLRAAHLRKDPGRGPDSVEKVQPRG